MERQYEYFAIVTERWPRVEDPRHVCRRWVDDSGQTHDEEFTTDLVWAPTTALSQAESGTGGVHRIDAAAATRFEHTRRERMSLLAPLDGRYSYFAWLNYRTDVDDPDGVRRTWKGPRGFELEEGYVAGSGWERSHLLDDLWRGRKDGELVPIDSEAVERIIQRWEQRRAERSPEAP
ncbi:hypothetical protein [Lentzea sp. NPDC004782]|uniref:hypothetical protein n=1 Tax=Lentzea sp. NPDC004782 TaxID=3154458 RepID=UPI00339F9D78